MSYVQCEVVSFVFLLVPRGKAHYSQINHDLRNEYGFFFLLFPSTYSELFVIHYWDLWLNATCYLLIYS